MTRDGGAAAHALPWVQAALGDRPMPPMAVLIGLGDGAVLDAIDGLRPGVRLLLVEPDAAVAAAFRASDDGRRRLAAGTLLCLGGPDYAGADEAWRLYPPNPDDHVLLVSPDAARDRARVLEAARLVGKILFGARANAEARRHFAPRYLANSLANLPAIARGSSVAALAGAFAGRPVVVVGAGPSLDAALADLAALQNRAVVIATDTTLRPLLHAGIEPHLVVGADPSARNARHFFGLPPCPRTWLVAESALDPDAAATFAGRTFWFRVSEHDPWPWFGTLGVETGPLDMWGSVLTAAFRVALLGGGGPITFIGADLAYTGGRPYARGTTYEFDWAYTAALGVGLEEAWRQQTAMTERLTTRSVTGGLVETSRPLQVFGDWLVNRIGRCGRRVFNATGGGILAGPGIEQTTLRAAIGGGSTVPAPVWRCTPTTSTPLTALAGAVADVRDAVDANDADQPLVRAWTAFSGGAFDRAAVRAALDRAAAGCGGEPSVTPDLPSLPWPALVAAGVPLKWFHDLPAHVTTANGTASDARIRCGAPWLLAPLVPMLEAGAVAIDASSAADVMSSALAPGLRPWPPLVAWPLRLFDALVPETEPGPASFFAPPAPTPGPACPGATLAQVARALASQVSVRWMRAAVGHSSDAQAARVRGVAALIEGAGEPDPPGRALGPALTVSLTGGGAPAVQVTRRVAGAHLPRVLTGCLRVPAAAAARPARLASYARHGARIDVDVSDVAAVVTPRVLTAEGLAPSASAYGVEGGAVVAPLHRHASTWIGEDGAVRPFASWPRTIVGELPMGEGAVAWSNGTGAWPDLDPGYVMYRTTSAGPVRVDALPFRPTAGAWFNGHLYWNTFRTGLGRWRPGTPGELLLDDETCSGVFADGEALVLAPATRDTEGRVVRRVHAAGSRLRADGTREGVALPAEGAATSRVTGPDGWTATAHPDADVILLERAGRRVDLTCHYPMTVAWAGRSLVTCTAPGDVLLFERLADTVSAFA